MTCKNCNEDDEVMENLKREGREFMDKAIAICLSCEKLTTILGFNQCSICKCFVKIKIESNRLFTTHCPLKKW